ncbi:MAG: ATP-dependent Lon protease, partial [Solirubrobacterales bacterium]|nr:ATP-dependent Lon protease [Solirubrobacterales bacterium]
MAEPTESGAAVLDVIETPDVEDAIRAIGPLPDALPVLPLRETVTFPDTLTPLAVGQPRSIKLVDDVLNGNRQLVMAASRDPELDEPGPDQVHRVGVAGVVARMLKIPDGSIRILVQGQQRVRLDDFVAEQPYLVARISEMPDVIVQSAELQALTRNVQSTFSEIIEQIPYLPEELQLAVTNIDEPSALSHLIAGALRISMEEKQELLEEVDVAKRLRRLSEILARELEVIQLGTKIQSQVQSEIDKGQREYLLRQQLKAIQEELGEVDDQQAETNELRERLEAAELPEQAAKAAERELTRLEKLPSASAEYGVIRTYLEWLVELPWSKATDDNLDIDHARGVLDEDHYDLEKVKDRILEYLAVRKLNPASPGPILCFVGPPGVGKTSLGRSISRALGREFERISVGGVRDEAEIRGHRRTYIGAMPGTIIRALRDAGSRNPVFMIDEIDKMGADFRGDPASAMLEVLDPAQNTAFRDHYLDLEVDLSEVMFIATANILETIPGPLQDRMEVIQLAGYTHDEKLHIARRYLVPRQIKANGLKPSQIELTDAALNCVIEEYTREAGVRNLEREIGTVCRKVARDVAEGKVGSKVSISAKRVRELLGRRRYFAETRRRTKHPGVATGLAWTPAGGEVLFIEATAMPGAGKLTITGQLGDVMRESAQAALSYVRGNIVALAPDLGADWFAEHDIHVHVPAGAVPKDGPSAGVAMVTALASMVTSRAVANDVAMTGEITLTGQVLPVGGLKEKT